MDSVFSMPCGCGHNRSDPGPVPFATNIPQVSQQNQNFRAAVWTGTNLQLTVMCIPSRGEIGLEIHPQTDQLIRVEEGQASVRMGQSREQMAFQRCLGEGDAVLIPCGIWHNVVNTGNRTLKLSSIYAPPQHPRAAVHRTKAEAEHEEK
ncbi:MAG: cupin domain-containing protein [Faecousia sp.]